MTDDEAKIEDDEQDNNDNDGQDYQELNDDRE